MTQITTQLRGRWKHFVNAGTKRRALLPPGGLLTPRSAMHQGSPTWCKRLRTGQSPRTASVKAKEWGSRSSLASTKIMVE
jgi:hypothetical protein